MTICATWNQIKALPAEEYARLRLEAENRLLMRGMDEHSWNIVKWEMVKISRERENET